MELLCVFPLMIVIYVVMQLQKQQPTQNNPQKLTEDQKYMAVIALDKLAHGDENWTHPWEL